jgi:hypothetical protein
MHDSVPQGRVKHLSNIRAEPGSSCQAFAGRARESVRSRITRRAHPKTGSCHFHVGFVPSVSTRQADDRTVDVPYNRYIPQNRGFVPSSSRSFGVAAGFDSSISRSSDAAAGFVPSFSTRIQFGKGSQITEWLRVSLYSAIYKARGTPFAEPVLHGLTPDCIVKLTAIDIRVQEMDLSTIRMPQVLDFMNAEQEFPEKL